MKFSSTSSLLLKDSKPTKSFKLNRRMTTLHKVVQPYSIPINNYQIIPTSSLWTNTQSNQMITQINTNPTPSPPVITPPSINRQQKDTSVGSSFKSFYPHRVTTTLIPLNVCHTDHCQTVETTSIPSHNIVENHQDQNTLERNSAMTIHLIGDWIIRESSQPFQRNEKKSTEQLIKQEKQIISDRSTTSYQSTVSQWSTDEVCSFFEYVLGNNSYASIIKEHLIDGSALLLLEDEHLFRIFKMQLGPRLKLLNKISKIKNGSTL